MWGVILVILCQLVNFWLEGKNFIDKQVGEKLGIVLKDGQGLRFWWKMVEIKAWENAIFI